MHSCSMVLTQELKKYQRFIHGLWFKDSRKSPVEFARMMTQIIRYGLLCKGENKPFWDLARDYVKSNSGKITESSSYLFEHFEMRERSNLVDHLKQRITETDWLWPLIPQTVTKVIVSRATDETVDLASKVLW
ncbi:hypothetical protein ACFL2Q_20200 [Thermodesulfobacteriota bacterium]